MAKAKKREWWTISWDRKRGAWRVDQRGDGYQHHCIWLHPDGSDKPATKREVVKNEARRMRARWLEHGIPCELVIKTKDGRIQDRRTYGLDPRGRG